MNNIIAIIIVILCLVVLILVGYVVFDLIRENIDIDLKKHIKNIARFIKSVSYGLWHLGDN